MLLLESGINILMGTKTTRRSESHSTPLSAPNGVRGGTMNIDPAGAIKTTFAPSLPSSAPITFQGTPCCRLLRSLPCSLPCRQASVALSFRRKTIGEDDVNDHE